MTPKEKSILDKSKYLVQKFIGPTQDWDEIEGKWQDNPDKASECALFAVDEILDVLGGVGVYSFADTKVTTYWEDVKAEIEKL